MGYYIPSQNLFTRLCPRCGGIMVYKGTYHDREKGRCNIYECDRCGYREEVCYKTTYTYSTGIEYTWRRDPNLDHATLNKTRLHADGTTTSWRRN